MNKTLLHRPTYVDGHSLTEDVQDQPVRRWRFYATSGEPIELHDAAIQARTAFARLFPDGNDIGFTIFRSTGGWRAPSGKYVLEQSFVVEILDHERRLDNGNGANLAWALGQLWRQEAVMFTSEPVSAGTVFLSAAPAEPVSGPFTTIDTVRDRGGV